MYDPTKVDWSPKEHERAKAQVDLYQAIDGALDDGFQPLPDLTVIGPAVWGYIDHVRQFFADFSATNGRRPTPAEVSAAFGQAGFMVARHEGVLPKV